MYTDWNTPIYEMGNDAKLNWPTFYAKKLQMSVHNAFLLDKRGVMKACLYTRAGTGIKIILLRTELCCCEAYVCEAQYEMARDVCQAS